MCIQSKASDILGKYRRIGNKKKWYIGAKTVICVGKYSESRGKYSGIFEKYVGKGNHTITDLGYGEIDIISPSTLIFASING